MSSTTNTPAYERDPRLRELDTEVLAVGRHGDRDWAVLADTIFYPEGGGQPADHGTLGPATVLDVSRTEEDGVRHFLSQPVSAGPTRLVLDWGRRFDHMQQHTAQHLLTAVAADRFRWPTTSFHLGDRLCNIELGAANVSANDLERLEVAVATEVRAARPVTTRRVSLEEYQRLEIGGLEVGGLEVGGFEVRTRGLPKGHRGDVRLVSIEGIDTSTCGGTHLTHTGEIEAVKLLGTEPMRGGTRLSWIAGGRVRQRLAETEQRNTEMRALLECSDDELQGLVVQRLATLRAQSRRIKELTGRLADIEGRALGADGRPVAAAHFDDADGAFLQLVARQFLAGEPGPARVALLTATNDAGSSFVVATRDPGLDAAALGRRVAEVLEGKGGGAGNLYQGRAKAPQQRGRALEGLLDELASDADSQPP